jgi:hypothetical protein
VTKIKLAARAPRRGQAFISFADPDRHIAVALGRLLDECGLKAYVAPEDLPKAGEPNWRSEICKAIKSSTAFVPILTKGAIVRRWVMYEWGVADCAGLPVLGARTATASHDDIRRLPGLVDLFVYSLEAEADLVNLILAIGQHSGLDLRQIENLVRNGIAASVHARTILAAARTRWVFIAGSPPQERTQFERLRLADDPAASPEDALKRIAADIAKALLAADFHLSACSETPCVGQAVTQAFSEWAGRAEHWDRFRLRGMYPLDRNWRTINAGVAANEMVSGIIHEYRRSYLQDVEALIIVGGNQGTEEEVRAALELEIPVFCVPIAGGVAARLWTELGGLANLPIESSAQTWRTEMADAVVKAVMAAGVPPPNQRLQPTARRRSTRRG